MKSAQERLAEGRPEIRNAVPGLPHTGMRSDGARFYDDLRKIDLAYTTGNSVYRMNVIHDSGLTAFNAGNGSPLSTLPFPPAAEAAKALFDHPEISQYGYASGDEGCRESVAEYLSEIGMDAGNDGRPVHRNQIIFFNSTTEAFNEVIRLITRPGDVVLFTAPTYGLFAYMPERVGAITRLLPLHSGDGWLPDPDKLEAAITEINTALTSGAAGGTGSRVAAFVNLNPCNPTGKVMDIREKARLARIERVCRENGAFVIDDIIYRDLCFDERRKAFPIAALDGAFENTITLFGTSKCYGLAGARAGGVAASEVVIRGLRNEIFQRTDSTPLQVSYLMAAAFNSGSARKAEYDRYFPPLLAQYRDNWSVVRTLVCGAEGGPEAVRQDILEDIRLEFSGNRAEELLRDGIPGISLAGGIVPESGFFAMIDFSGLRGRVCSVSGERIDTEDDVLFHFYKYANVKLLMGGSVAWPEKGEIVSRVSFAYSRQMLLRMFRQIDAAIALLE